MININKDSNKDNKNTDTNNYKQTEKDEKAKKNIGALKSIGYITLAAINREITALGYITQLGITMAATVMVGVFVGRFLDNLLNTSPWLLLICSLLGAGAAIRNLFSL